jgi:hypothetical protein
MPSVNALPVLADTQVNPEFFSVSYPPRFIAWAEIKHYARTPHFDHYGDLRLNLKNATDFWKAFFQCSSADMLDHYAQVFSRSFYYFIRNATKYPISELKYLNSTMGFEGQSLINFFGFIRSKEVKRSDFWNPVPGKNDVEATFNDYWSSLWLLGSAFDEEGTLGKDFNFDDSVFCKRTSAVDFINACVSYLRSLAKLEELLQGVQQEVLSEIHITSVNTDFMIRFIESRPSILDAALGCIDLTGVSNKIPYLASVVFSYSIILGASKHRVLPSHILRSVQHRRISPLQLAEAK